MSIKNIDTDYFSKKLHLVIRDLHLYNNQELSLELNRLSKTAEAGNQEVPVKKTVEELKSEAIEKLRAAEKALHAWACEEEVGPSRILAFNMYEIIRTAPRRAKE